jgi:hypothetical protein
LAPNIGCCWQALHGSASGSSSSCKAHSIPALGWGYSLWQLQKSLLSQQQLLLQQQGYCVESL